VPPLKRREKMLNILNRDMILGAAFAAVTLSILAYAFVGSELGIFVGLWAPTFLLAGQYLLPENN
jgi:hypothetical protein